MASSQNGWPASDEPRTIGVESYQIPGTRIKIRVSKKVAPLLINFCAEFNAEIEPLEEGGLDDWGYCYRVIRGSKDSGNLSNHASATAVDLNSRRHPLGSRGTFTPEQEKKIRLLAKKYGLRWGGDYKNRADEMHFEICLSPLEVKELIIKLGLDEKKEK
ncbi:MAG: M15 family peptidase [Gammaproteobacteria bacterium]|nr:M15 family peptidase [Gammaproteobacteria bacterium]